MNETDEVTAVRIEGPAPEVNRLPIIAWSMVVCACLVASGVAWPYFAMFDGHLSENSEDWARFGTYFGGVAGSLIALISVFGLVLTLLMQNRQIVIGEKRALAELHIRSLGELTRDIENIEIKSLGHGATVGEILDHPSKLNAGLDRQQFIGYARHFAELLHSYAATVAMYRDNVQPYWDVRVFEDRGLRNLERLTPHLHLLGPLAAVGAKIIEGHLRNTLQVSAK